MKTDKKLKLSKKQKEIILKMQKGWILVVGRSEVTERIYYQVTKGYKQIFFTARVFYNLLQAGLIEQERGVYYELTSLGKSVK